MSIEYPEIDTNTAITLYHSIIKKDQVCALNKST